MKRLLVALLFLWPLALVGQPFPPNASPFIRTNFLLSTEAAKARDNLNVPYTAQALFTTPVIYDADFGEDWGKLLSGEMLWALHQQGYVRVIAIGVQGTNPAVGAGMKAFANYHGVYAPIGLGNTATIARNPYDYYAYFLATNYNVSTNASDYPLAVNLYRQTLANAANNSVVWFEEAQLENLYDLFVSAPDAISPLTGQQLIEQKVKEFIIIAGVYGTPYGYEGNFYYSPTKAVVANWITNCVVTWSQGTGGDYGHPKGWVDWVNVASNAWAQVSGYDCPLRVGALAYHLRTGAPANATPFQPAWAEMGMLYLRYGLTNTNGTVYFTSVQGSNYIYPNGSNIWSAGSTLNWQYLTSSWAITGGLTTNQYITNIQNIMYSAIKPTQRIETAYGKTPKDVPGLMGWLESDFNYYIADNVNITNWHDQSGVQGMINVTPTVAGAGVVPTNRVNVLNGKPGIFFHQAVGKGWASSFLEGNQKPFTVMGVVLATNANSAMPNGIMGATAPNLGVRIYANKFEIEKVGTASIATSSGGIVNSNIYHFCITYDSSGNYAFWTNGVRDNIGVNNQTFGSSSGTFIGTEQGAGNGNFGGYIFAVMKWNRVLSLAEIKQMFYYLNRSDKYNSY